MELFHANKQWAERPADERFTSLEEMYEVTKKYALTAREKEVAWSDLRVVAQGDDLTLVGKKNLPAKLSNYAFGQLAARVGAPANYLRSLTAGIAETALNHGLRTKGGSSTALLLFHQNDGLLLRAATSDRYSRIWNHDVIKRLIDLSGKYDLVPARQTMTWDGSALPENRPPALYASDHDMWAFVMSHNRAVLDPVGKELYRGLIVTNSEVGDRSLGIMGFWFRDLCTNHIIWGAEQIAEISLVHTGDIQRKWYDAVLTAKKYLDSDTSFEKARFEQLKVRIAGTKDEVLDAVFNHKSLQLTRKSIDASYDAVIPEQDGDPRTPWGLAQGITRYSQQQPFADERYALDRAAGKLLSIDF